MTIFRPVLILVNLASPIQPPPQPLSNQKFREFAPCSLRRHNQTVSASVCFRGRRACPPTGGTAASHSQARGGSTGVGGETDGGCCRGGGALQDGVVPKRKHSTTQHSQRENWKGGTTHLPRRPSALTSDLPTELLPFPRRPRLAVKWRGRAADGCVCPPACVCVCVK